MNEKSEWHPHWCTADACTAYADPDAVDCRYHRSRPIVVDTDDPFIALYVHLGVNADGSQMYVGMAELERPFTRNWFDSEPTCGRSFAMPIDQADALRHALASAVRVSRPRPVRRSGGAAPPGTPRKAA